MLPVGSTESQSMEPGVSLVIILLLLSSTLVSLNMRLLGFATVCDARSNEVGPWPAALPSWQDLSQRIFFSTDFSCGLSAMVQVP